VNAAAAATAVFAAAAVLAAVAWVIRCAVLQEAWGRVFNRDLDLFVLGGKWVSAGTVCEALSLELIQRSDRLTTLRS
jgi:hypothetical protein